MTSHVLLSPLDIPIDLSVDRICWEIAVGLRDSIKRRCNVYINQV